MQVALKVREKEQNRGGEKKKKRSDQFLFFSGSWLESCTIIVHFFIFLFFWRALKPAKSQRTKKMSLNIFFNI